MLKLQIKATHLPLTPEIEAYITEKVSAFEKLIPESDSSAALSVEVGKTTLHHKSGNVFKAEFNLHVAGKTIYAVSEKDNLYAALDEVKDEVIRALRSHKDREKTLLRRGGTKIKKMLKGFYRGGKVS